MESPPLRRLWPGQAPGDGPLGSPPPPEECHRCGMPGCESSFLMGPSVTPHRTLVRAGFPPLRRWQTAAKTSGAPPAVTCAAALPGLVGLPVWGRVPAFPSGRRGRCTLVAWMERPPCLSPRCSWAQGRGEDRGTARPAPAPAARAHRLPTVRGRTEHS